MVLMYQWERCTHILYTPFPLLYDYVLEWKTENYKKIWFSCTNGNGVHTFCIHRSCYCMTMIWGGKPKIIEKIVLMYQWERCTHILYTPFPLLYDYVLEWKTINYKKVWFSCTNGNGVHTFYIHRSRYSMTMFWSGKSKIIKKYGSHVPMGTVYTHSVYPVPVTV